MTIDEAIEKFKLIANSDAPCPRYCMLPCDKCVDESKQLAEWLEELKDYQDKNKMVVRIDCANSEQFKDIAVKLAKEQYNKAIDDCKELTFREVVYYDSLNDRTEFRELAEQLKVGDMDEEDFENACCDGKCRICEKCEEVSDE